MTAPPRPALAAILGAGVVAMMAASAAPAARAADQTASGPATTVQIGTGPGLGAFDPASVLGADLDGHDQGSLAQVYTPVNLRAMASAGLPSISQRLRTELGVEAWHWNPAGRFSDPRSHEGYWTSSPTAGRLIGPTYGYALPRRGDSVDQANDVGYSRLDDGDAASFWKSDPYLDPRLAGHAPEQWVLIDLGRRRPVDEVSVLWGTPWATRVRVQWWTGVNAIYPAAHPPASWRDFPRGSLAGHGGAQLHSLGHRPLRVRFVRLLLERSSHTAPPGSRDLRDRLGFAVRELGLGVRGRHGTLRDEMRHAPDGGRQTTTMTSSTDPWHRASDRDPGYAQPSFDQIEGSGLTRGRPLMVPVAVLYGTPDDAVNELRFLHARRYPLGRVELGEEPDGQLSEPEGYAALYARFARALRRVDRAVPLGGPGFQTSLPDWRWWPDRRGRRSWTGRFVAELARRGMLSQLDYFSFEWYPFDLNCRDTGGQLQRQPALLADVIERQRRAGLPARLPLVITELGYSAFAGRVEDDLPGAVLDVDAIAGFLQDGGQTAYLYGLEPAQPMQETRTCATWGNLTLFNAGDNGQARQPVATYWAMRMLRDDWAGDGGTDTRLGATGGLAGANGHGLVGAYAVRRADGRIAVLLVNRDVTTAHRAILRLGRGALRGPLQVAQLGPGQYVWHPRGPHGFAQPDGPPARWTLPAGLAAVTLPPTSVTVVRTEGPA